MSPHIEKVLLRSFLFGLGAISVQALLPLVARDLLSGGPLVYGILLGAFGIGAIGGAFLGGRLRGRFASETIVRGGFTGFATCCAIAAFGTSLWQAGIAMLIGGACWVLSLSLFNVTVQLSTPRWVVGRVLALYQTATFGGMALGSWAWGAVAEAYGPDIGLLCAGAVLLIGALIGLAMPLPQDTSLNLDPADRWREPRLSLDLKPRSGPIFIMIDYIIKEADTEAFLEAMIERQRIRRRDGARNWALARDLENPELWMESYHTPTWVEYVRHNRRMTHADAVVGDKIRALHSGSEPPRVRRMIERPTDWTASMFANKSVMDLH
jgi:MFS family permease